MNSISSRNKRLLWEFIEFEFTTHTPFMIINKPAKFIATLKHDVKPKQTNFIHINVTLRGLSRDLGRITRFQTDADS